MKKTEELAPMIQCFLKLWDIACAHYELKLKPEELAIMISQTDDEMKKFIGCAVSTLVAAVNESDQLREEIAKLNRAQIKIVPQEKK